MSINKELIRLDSEIKELENAIKIASTYNELLKLSIQKKELILKKIELEKE